MMAKESAQSCCIIYKGSKAENVVPIMLDEHPATKALYRTTAAPTDGGWSNFYADLTLSETTGPAITFAGTSTLLRGKVGPGVIIACAFATGVCSVKRCLYNETAAPAIEFVAEYSLDTSIFQHSASLDVGAPAAIFANASCCVAALASSAACFNSSFRQENRRAENWGLDPSWLDLAFWGAPIFSPEVPKYLLQWVLGPLDGKSGRPKNAKSNKTQRIQPSHARPSEKKTHKHKPFAPVGLGRPQVCPRDKPDSSLGQTRLSLGQAQVFSLFYTVEARFAPGTNPVRPTGQTRG